MDKKGLFLSLLVFILVFLSFKYSAEIKNVSDEVIQKENQISLGLDGDTWLGMDEYASKMAGFMGFDEAKGKAYEGIAMFVKSMVLKGILDGLVFGKSPEIEKYYLNTSYEFYIQALDQFYSDYKNRKIYIPWAMQVISLEIKGAPKEEIEIYLTRLRELAFSMIRNK